MGRPVTIATSTRSAFMAALDQGQLAEAAVRAPGGSARPRVRHQTWPQLGDLGLTSRPELAAVDQRGGYKTTG